MIGRTAGWIFLISCVGSLAWIAAAVARDRRSPQLSRWGWATVSTLWAVTAIVLAARFTVGLGATTAMTDRFPWGVWIGFIQAGVALSAGGFVMAATVHVFHIRRFEPILRPAVLTAFLGYSFVAASLFIEVGRPYRLWHPLAMWQDRSIMFEVAWCVTLYMSVLALEFSPVVFEKLRLEGARRVVGLVTIPLVIAGVLLSTLHQSSMGSMFLLVPQKIHPLWYTPLLPVLFLLSSVAVGMCVIIVESFFSARIFGHGLELPLLRDLGRSASWVLILFLLTRTLDLTARGAWRMSTPTRVEGLCFWVEFLGGFVLPATLLSLARIRQSPRALVSCALLVMAGVVFNRLNTSWIGMVSYAGPVYFPSWMELSITFSLATAVVVVFGLAASILPVFPETRDKAYLSSPSRA